MKVINQKKEPKERRASAQAPQVMSSTDLINDEVTNNAGENLGRIEKLMVDLRTGNVLYAVLSYGSLLAAKKYIAVPWQALNFSHHDKRFVLNIEKDRLGEAPVFDQSRWPEQAEPGWIGDLYHYYGFQAPRIGEPEKTTRQGLPASALINSTVMDSEGKAIGKLKDLFVDLNNNEIVFVAVTTGSILGMDNKYFAVPADILTIQEDKLIVNASKEKLEGGPSFAKDSWPDVNDEKWVNSLYDYYTNQDNTATPQAG